MHVDNFICFPILPLISPKVKKMTLMDFYFQNRNAGKTENKNFTNVYQELTWRAETVPLKDRHYYQLHLSFLSRSIIPSGSLNLKEMVLKSIHFPFSG